MCEILIKIDDRINPDPEINRRCYKKGMAVAVFEDGHTWGRLESKQQWIAEGNTAASWPSQGIFVIVKIPTVLAAKAQALLEHQTEDDLGNPLVDADGRPIVYRHRRFKLFVDDIPLAVRNTLATNGEITVTVAQIRAYLKRIRDNAQFTGLD